MLAVWPARQLLGVRPPSPSPREYLIKNTNYEYPFLRVFLHFYIASSLIDPNAFLSNMLS